MARNDQNLVPSSERTPEERKEIARKGGKASAAAKRRKKALKEYMETLLDCPPTGEYSQLAAEFGLYGNEDVGEVNNRMVLVTALFKRAVKDGDVSAFREVVKLIGEDKSADDSKEQRARIDKLQAEAAKAKRDADAGNISTDNRYGIVLLSDVLPEDEKNE